MSISTKTLADRAPYSAPPNPDLRAYWEAHKRLLWWWARKIASILNRSRGARQWEDEDIIGYLVIKFNYTLHHYTPPTTFATYFSAHIIGQVIQDVVSPDSERAAITHFQRTRSADDHRESCQNMAFHEAANYLYRVPERDTWADEMIELLGQGDSEKAFDRITEGLGHTARTIIDLRWRHGTSLHECAKQFHISKQRVFQIERATLRTIRDRLLKYEPVRRLLFSD